jgi:alpha-galactosidase
MKLRTAVLLLAACAIAAAADFTGRWVGDLVREDGGRREYQFILKPEGGKVTGQVVMPNGAGPIIEGTINGDQINFVASQNEKSRTKFSAVLKGDELHVTVPAGRGVTGEVVAHRVSRDPVPAPPPAITLPELKPLPYNGLAKTPPMGWNSWNKFRTGINDKLIREIADAMVSSGMKKAGYTFVNIDDGWEAGRDASGNIQSNSRFPDMKALADYVHSKGLKLGIYSSPGPRTCAGFEGSFNHEAQDANTWAAWGIDYIKYDWCSAARVYKSEQMRIVYQKMGEALLATRRPIVFSLCQYGREHVEQWGALVSGNLWRTTDDIRDSWDSMSGLGFDKQTELTSAAGPGHWNDPDMLEIGNGAMSDTEYRTHMSLWSMLAAPLIAGNDLRSMTPAIHDILTNPEVIAIDQDPLGKEGKAVSKSGELEVWARPLKGGAYAVGLFNRGPATAKITARWSDIGISGKYKLRDLWEHVSRGTAASEYAAEVPSHGVVLLKLTK